MALYRNIAGVFSGDEDTLKCDDLGCGDNAGGDGIINLYRPTQGSGVFPEIQQYPYEPIQQRVQEPVTTTVVNTAPVLPAPGVDHSMDKPDLKLDGFILAIMGFFLYTGMTRKDNNTQTAVYLAGVGLLFYRMKQRDKKPLPVTE